MHNRWFVMLWCFCCVGALAVSQVDVHATNGDRRVAVVTDEAGVLSRVTDLRVRYRAGGIWQTDRPEKDVPRLEIRLEGQEGYVTTKETIRIPLDQIKELTMTWSPFDMKIERTDSVQVTLTNKKYEERNAKGEVTQSIDITSTSISLGDERVQVTSGVLSKQVVGHKTVPVEIVGFSGRAKTSSGKEGDFFIPISKVKSLTFEEVP